MALTRRALVGGVLVGIAAPAVARAPDRSLIPPPRPGATDADGATPPATSATRVTGPRARSVEDLLAEARLGGQVSFAVADARTGLGLEARARDEPMPPASTAKAITAAYALDQLGPDHRFRTRLVATGPVSGGRLDGDLILMGGGDPTLDTDGLDALARDLVAAGVRQVAGRFLWHDRSLPAVPAIDPDQPDHVGYNPAIAGLNLNYNRVHFEWARGQGGWRVGMDARSDTLRPEVRLASVRVVDRASPVFTYENGGGTERWTVASRALGERGSRWLPTRMPGAYTAEVFAWLAARAGCALPAPERAGGRIEGRAIAERPSGPLTRVARDMLSWSTNLTAETLGLSVAVAGGAAPARLADSAALMNRWLVARAPGTRPAFVDHSGLSPASRISASDMVAALVALGPDGAMAGLLKDFPMRDQGVPHAVAVRAKTGTLNFVSALAGYARLPSGHDLAFAIFTGDLDRRRGVASDDAERPAGGREWSGRARALQRALIDRWATLYGAG
ncbi:MAG: D-alanyl-D-alanine carboxypeptidase/D-alanyl-D-alanine-endopeptidase [Rhodobacteraceae bacterium]|nr:D-alanyl-D-alanine carboxypeptidase/D-alanyl-D-alanine-endopeptidase [Paracoccaceae bacterium]